MKNTNNTYNIKIIFQNVLIFPGPYADQVQSGATLMINSSPLLNASVFRSKRHSDSIAVEINELSWIILSMIDNMMENIDENSVNCDKVVKLCQRSKRLVKIGKTFSSKLLPVWR